MMNECRHCGWLGPWEDDDCGICPDSLADLADTILEKPGDRLLFPRHVTQAIADGLRTRRV